MQQPLKQCNELGYAPRDLMHQINVALWNSAWVVVAQRAHMAPTPRRGTSQENGGKCGLPRHQRARQVRVTQDRGSRVCTQGGFPTIMCCDLNGEAWCYKLAKSGHLDVPDEDAVKMPSCRHRKWSDFYAATANLLGCNCDLLFEAAEHVCNHTYVGKPGIT